MFEEHKVETQNRLSDLSEVQRKAFAELFLGGKYAEDWNDGVQLLLTLTGDRPACEATFLFEAEDEFQRAHELFSEFPIPVSVSFTKLENEKPGTQYVTSVIAGHDENRVMELSWEFRNIAREEDNLETLDSSEVGLRLGYPEPATKDIRRNDFVMYEAWFHHGCVRVFGEEYLMATDFVPYQPRTTGRGMAKYVSDCRHVLEVLEEIEQQYSEFEGVYSDLKTAGNISPSQSGTNYIYRDLKQENLLWNAPSVLYAARALFGEGQRQAQEAFSRLAL